MADVQGFVAPGFEPVRTAFAASFDAGDELGASFAAMRDGETLVDVWGGFADRAGAQKWQRDTVAPAYSTTKGIVAFVMAMLVDRGQFSYEDRVADLWPEFAAHGKGDVTIAQMLAHQAGVPGFPEAIDPALWLDPPACAQAIAALAPMWPPGSASGYHPITWGYLAGEIVQRATGRTLGAILREDICAPHAIDFSIGLAEQDDARCADVVKPKRVADFGEMNAAKKAAFLTSWSAPNRGDVRWRRVEIPSANGHGHARSVAQLYALYATRGFVGGERVLSEAAFAALTERRFFGQDVVLPFTIDWRTGVMGNSNLFYGTNAEAFGHSGAGGSCGFGDPVSGISVGYVMNKQSHHIMGDPRTLRLIEALYSCL